MLFFYFIDILNLLSLVYGDNTIRSHFRTQNNYLRTNINHVDSSHIYKNISTFASYLIFTNFENGTLLAKELKV